MAQPTVFVQFVTRNESNPVARAIGAIAKLAGGVLIEQLVDAQEVEANIAVVNTVEVALRLLKESEKTIVFLGYLGNTGFCASENEAQAFAARFPDRVKAIALVGDMTVLMQTITEMGKDDA